MGDRAMIAMSGGVDSSVAAYIMKERGFECVGVTMKLFRDGGEPAEGRVCCSLEDVEDARAVAYRLGMVHYVLNLTADFERDVMARFAAEYRRGRTPNPCIDCNRYIKFSRLLERAAQLDIGLVATGHYARIERDGKTGKFLLKKALDAAKDQSYVLYRLSQGQLGRVLFPLGEMTKAEVRAAAERQGFVNARKGDSQDICFVPDGDYGGFIERYTGLSSGPGDFIDARGKTLGRHRGHIRYTIGQRRGLGLAMGRPVYVLGKNAAHNTVTVGEPEGLFARELIADDVSWVSGEPPRGPVRVRAKTRYRQAEQLAEACLDAGGRLRVVFDEPQRAMTPGQAAVLYDGETVLGGGVISEVADGRA
jgi:tRNA-specific 2-thiouridylase